MSDEKVEADLTEITNPESLAVQHDRETELTMWICNNFKRPNNLEEPERQNKDCKNNVMHAEDLGVFQIEQVVLSVFFKLVE